MQVKEDIVERCCGKAKGLYINKQLQLQLQFFREPSAFNLRCTCQWFFRMRRNLCVIVYTAL
jgi:hypothetical protein